MTTTSTNGISKGAAASPSFAIRGVIEGFYGPVWPLEQRLDLVEFIAHHGMNFYGYAPKDDPYCRHGWDRALPDERLDDVQKLVAAGEQSGVAIGYGLSPGLSICYSNQADRQRLLAKYRQLAAVGITHFLLLFDDLPLEFLHEADQAVYHSLAHAHAELANFVYGALKREIPHATLKVCPTVYCGRGDERYLRDLGATLDKRIDIFWTGRTVWSSVIEARDAAGFAENAGRPPLYWDNYPANDLDMAGHMHLGPYRGRDRDLPAYARGVLVNPMTQCEASKIPLATIGDYLGDPQGYDPEASWQRAIAEVAGVDDAAAIALFADNVRSSCLEPANSPLLSAALERLRFASRFGPAEAERRAAVALVERFIAAGDHLLGPQVANTVLAAELRPWIAAFRDGAVTLRDALADGRMAEVMPPKPPSVFSSLALVDLLPDATLDGRWPSITALPLVENRPDEDG